MRRAADIIAFYEAIGRTRALTERESVRLERAIERERLDNTEPIPAALWTRDDDLRLCDLVAEGHSTRAAGRMMGKSVMAAVGRFERIRRPYGWQGE